MVTIKISTANAAFDVPGPEIARILRELADKVDADNVLDGYTAKVQDANGNTVGSFRIHGGMRRWTQRR